MRVYCEHCKAYKKRYIKYPFAGYCPDCGGTLSGRWAGFGRLINKVEFKINGVLDSYAESAMIAEGMFIKTFEAAICGGLLLVVYWILKGVIL